MLDHALALARLGFEVFPLAGKVPAIPGGRGCLDATTDLEQIGRWWATRPAANIGLRVPVGQVVLDTDPRHGGEEALTLLLLEHGLLPPTRTAESGRGDDGRHFHFQAPDAPLSSKRLPQGIDLKTRGGYVVAPPSLHPDSGLPYRWFDRREAAQMPHWLAALVTRQVVVAPYGGSSSYIPRFGNDAFASSIADEFCSRASWSDVLRPHRWEVKRGDGDSDGSVWLHPTATSGCSATVRHGCLFVYSPNTPFEVTEPETPHGYTRFRAYAKLNYACLHSVPRLCAHNPSVVGSSPTRPRQP